MSKSLTRLGRELDGPLGHFSEQFRYGHREILVLYAGLDPRVAIKGSIEHGWSPFGPSIGVPKLSILKRYLHLAWSSEGMRRSGITFPKNVQAVGAPFLYLIQVLRREGILNAFSPSKRYLFIPPHGAEDEVPRYEGIIREYESFHDPFETTVQLYWTEYVNPEVRRLFENRGFTLSCAGFCGMTLNEGLGISTRERAVSVMGGRNLFLLNTVENLLRHQEVVMGTIGTSTLYAGYLGKKIRLLPSWNRYGKVLTHELDDLKIENQVDPLSPYFQYCKEAIVDRFLEGDILNAEGIRRYSALELGEDDILSSSELHEVISENSFTIPSRSAVEGLTAALQEIKSW